MIDFLEDEPSKPREQDLTPLINIIFLILIFFMLAAAIAPADDAAIEPVLSSSDAAVPDNSAVDITIDSNAVIYIDGQELSADQIKQKLLELGHSTNKALLSIKADATLDANVLISLLAGATDAGIDSVSLMTIRR